jgi:hypothetical protein
MLAATHLSQSRLTPSWTSKTTSHFFFLHRDDEYGELTYRGFTALLLTSEASTGSVIASMPCRGMVRFHGGKEDSKLYII